MKGNKKLLIVAVLLLLIAVSYGTYAIYKSSATSSDSIRPAHWVVKANSTDIVANNTFTLGSLDCTGGSQVAKAAGTIAPGDSCVATIVVDATGSEVDAKYTVSYDASALTTANSQITVGLASGSDALTDTISYNASSMTATVKLAVTWNAVDSAAQNAEDITTATTSNLAIPVTVTVVQDPTGIAP